MEPLVQAAAELRSYGWLWLALGALILIGSLGSGATGFIALEVAAALVTVALSLFAVFAGLLLARRTGPAILYRKIFDRAPLAPGSIRREEPGRTLRRAVGSSFWASVAFVAAAVPAFAVALAVLGGGRPDELERIPAGGLAVGGAWTVVAGVAALRIAHYFTRWERAKGRLVLCRPRRAGLMAHVYVVVEAPEPPGAPPAARG